MWEADWGLKKSARTYEVEKVSDDPLQQLAESRRSVRRLLKTLVKAEKGVKVGETLTVKMVRGLVSENNPQDVFFKTYSVAVTNTDDVEEVVDKKLGNNPG